MNDSRGRKAIIVGISGASSSGKTTLARLLRDIFPNTFILHEDDFYKPETELPKREGFVDWDCAGAIAIPDMAKALSHIRTAGSFPVSYLTKTPSRTEHGVPTRDTAAHREETDEVADQKQVCVHASQSLIEDSMPSQPFVDSKEDKNSVGPCPVSEAKIEAMRSKVAGWMQPGRPGHQVLADQGLKVCLVDGFLLYSPEMRSVMEQLDVKIFLLVSKAKATQRREARDGYVTLEGFWTDPPGYVDKVVWPNYAEAHEWLFERGDVEGTLDEKSLREKGVVAQVGKGLDIDMESTFEWTVETLMKRLEGFAEGMLEN